MIKRSTAAFAFRAIVGILVLASTAPLAIAAIGAGSLWTTSTTHTPTKWDVVIGTTVAAEIRGVLTSEVGNPLPATIPVIIKSTVLGNMTVIGTRIGTTSNYSFSYTPPNNACETVIVAYQSNGLNTNNDYLDDGLKNNSASAAAGFRFVTSNGIPVPCSEVGVQPEPWGAVKQLYR